MKDRITLCQERFKAALKQFRDSLPVGMLAEEAIWDAQAEAVARAARTYAVEMGRWSYLKAARSYRVNPVTAMTDYAIARDHEAHAKEVSAR